MEAGGARAPVHPCRPAHPLQAGGRGGVSGEQRFILSRSEQRQRPEPGTTESRPEGRRRSKPRGGRKPRQLTLTPQRVRFMARPMNRCPIHKVPLVCFCPACRGAVRSKRKAQSSRENGKLGGR